MEREQRYGTPVKDRDGEGRPDQQPGQRRGPGAKAAQPAAGKPHKTKRPAEHDPIVQDALRIFGGEVVETDEEE